MKSEDAKESREARRERLKQQWFFFSAISAYFLCALGG